eukprot:TRINITY_DN1232_c0_g1_i5.p1 TRINITY_DN1232_c0_g1~~TRINITY_DN1232_c0_g1_i5.p1  ORF type:complete len:310 (-),score=106.80 TRINITY_DN1232_c0_g1_i5:65-994(-)
MMRIVLLSLACAAVVSSTSGVAKKIQRNINEWNKDVACWGRENALKYHVGLVNAIEQCSEFGSPASLVKPANPWQTAPQPIPSSPFQTLPASVSRLNPAKYQNWNSIWANYLGNNVRQRRQATDGLLETDEEDFQEFLEDFEEYKEDMGTKMGNLTCVLTKMGMLDSALQVNLAMYTGGFWDNYDLSKTLAASDPLWRQMMTSGFTDCYSIAQTFPQEALDKNPVSKVFGRHMIFFKCAAKVSKKCCYEAEMYDWIKTLYGEDPSFNWAQFGLPNNKYELAALTVKVMTETASDEEEFVGDFFYGDAHV